jgi:hypothetical protein
MGSGQQFTKCMAYLPTVNCRSTPGLELVVSSRAKAEEDFALGNRKSELFRAEIKKSGATKEYKSHHDYLSILREKQVPVKFIARNGFVH